MNYLKRKGGFTLVEVMMVVALLGILAAIAIPTYLGIQKRAARSEAKASLQAISVALEGYLAESNSYGGTGTYPYSGRKFSGHLAGTNIGAVANLGNASDLNYKYTLQVTTKPYYSVVASPVRGRVVGDIKFSLDSDGVKIPANW